MHHMTARRQRTSTFRVAAADAASQYDALDLGPLPPYASQSYANGLNSLGQVVGYAYENGFPRNEALVWTAGGTDGLPDNPQLRGLGSFAGSDYMHGSQAYAINAHGQVVGWANGTDLLLDPWHAFIWQAGTFTDLGTLGPAVGTSMARCITDTGLISGWSQTVPSGSLSGNKHAFVYDLTSSQMTDVGVDDSWANSINTAGQLVGAYTTPSGDKHALYWDANHGAFDLHQLASAGGNVSEAAAINANGLVVGWCLDGAGIQRAFSADLSSGQVQHVGGAGDSYAFSVNAAGLAVGRYQTEHPSLFDHALIWDTASGSAQDLGQLVDPGAGWNLEVAWSVNDAAQIAGFGQHTIGQMACGRGFRLTLRS
jgi:probable HAF family extracellular repeat protein